MKDVWEAISPLSIIDRMFTKDVPVFYNPLAEQKSTDQWIYDTAKKKEELNDDVKNVLRKVGELIETPQQVQASYQQELGPVYSQNTDITMPLTEDLHRQQEQVYVTRLRNAFKQRSAKTQLPDFKESAQYLSPIALGLSAGAFAGPPGAAIGGAIGAGVSGAMHLAKGPSKGPTAEMLEAAENSRYQHLDDNDLKLLLRGLSVEKPIGKRRHTFHIKR